MVESVAVSSPRTRCAGRNHQGRTVTDRIADAQPTMPPTVQPGKPQAKRAVHDPAPTPPDSHSATPLQARHWFLHRYDSDPASQNLALLARYRGPAAATDIASACRRAMGLHPQLLQRFEADGGQVRIHPAAAAFEEPQIVQVGSEAELSSALHVAQQRPLSLESGATAAVTLVQFQQQSWLCLVAHACVADHRSLQLVLLDVARELGWRDSRSPPSASRVPCTEKANGTVPDRSSDVDERYWLDRLGEHLTPLELPTLGPRPASKRHAAVRRTTRLTDTIAERIQSIQRQLGCSAEALYVAAFLVTLRRWTHQESFVIGFPNDLRCASSAVGPLTDILPFGIHIEPGTTLRSLLSRIDSLLADDRAHAGIPFSRLTQLLKAPRDASRHPVHQAAFRLSETGPIAIREDAWSLVETRSHECPKTPCDIELWVDCDDTATILSLLYDGAIHDDGMMRQLLAHCVSVLTHGSANVDSDIDAIAIVDAEERESILALGCGPEAPVEHRTVQAIYADAARRYGERPALIHGGTTLSYRDLDRLSNRIANTLEALGAGPDTCVGVCMDRSIDMVAAVLGILKAGAAYVPMDPSYPEDRLRVMVEDSSAKLVLVHRNRLGAFASGTPTAVYEDLLQTIEQTSDARTPAAGDQEALAYVIFTSGSTGRPKGVAMPHRSLVNLLEWQVARKPFAGGARVLQYSSLSFDVSFQEIFSTFASGGTLYLIGDDERRDPRRLLDAIIDLQIQRLFLPYVALRQLIEVANATDRCPSSLGEVITAGEQLRVDAALQAFFGRLPGATLDNQYGPSETHVITAHMLSGNPSAWPGLPPIGRPIQNNRTLILDGHGAPVPIGVQGELHLAGINVARGYFGRGDLTRERFVVNGLVDGPTYRTGDAARYRPDGSIDFLGRTDFQVKIRGYRIEPNEINDVLGKLPGIRQCLTKAVDGEQSGTRLISYVLVDDTAEFDQESLFREARRVLPEYMVPSAVVPLTTLPFTPSGKVDLLALPVPESPTRSARRIRPPGNATESALAEIWRQLLDLDEVGVEENFFDIGGDSLLAVQLFLAIERRFRLELPLSLLVEHPTIATLALAVDGDSDPEIAGYRSLRRIQRGNPARMPLFLVHGGGGNVVLFGRLARAISPELPVYAFEWDGWSGAQGQTSIEHMADLYVAELCRFRSSGPYRLGGHCIGGLIAMEMARRLRDLGHEVIDPLIVTDTPNLAAASYHPDMPSAGSPEADRLSVERASLERALAACVSHPDSDRESFEPPAHHRNRPRRLLLRYLKRAYALLGYGKLDGFRVNQALDRLALRVHRLLRRKVPMKHRALHATTTLTRAARQYRPTPYDGTIVYFRTRLFLGESLGLGGWWADTFLGFAELCPGGIDVHYVNATHNGVVDHPRTAEVIRQVLS
ncbi:MAG: amino acid adenylation domain-containing protein [Pseudomonadales bacterium]